MVFRTRKPSRNVLSLEKLPSGRSRYWIGHGSDAEIVGQGKDGHLRLDLEALRKDGEGFDEQGRHGPHARHDVLDLPAALPEHVDAAAHQHIAAVVEWALVFREVGGGQPVADDHVRTSFQHGRAQGRRLRSRIGVVPVHHQIAVRLDVTEHGPHHVALALTGLGAHDGTGLTGQTGRFVGGIVVIDIDIGIRQGLTVIPDHVPDGQRLVIAGDQDRDPVAFLLSLHIRSS